MPLREDRRYDLAFALVDAFACLEIAAILVMHARIAESLGIREELSGYVITSYLYPLFGMLALIFLFDRRIRGLLSPSALFLTGLLLFATGNGACGVASEPLFFFLGRLIMGVGAALSFAGQLWSAGAHFRHRIARILLWGEMGAALGDMAGPLLGALFTQISPEGWRAFFLFDAGVGLLTLGLAASGLRGRGCPAPLSKASERPAATDSGPSGGARDDRSAAFGGDRAAPAPVGVMIALQVAISILLVGSQYFFSDQLQQKMGEGPLMVGGMNLLVSAGSILGALWASRMGEPLERLPLRCVLGLLLSLAGLAACLMRHAFLLSGMPLLAVGLFSGLGCVSVYTSIVESSEPDRFLRGALAYLLGMQIGNVLGVQTVGVAEWYHCGIPASASILAILPGAIALGALRSSRRRGPIRVSKVAR
jgi:MFS family permease